MVEGKGGGSRDPGQTVTKISEGGGSGLTRYVTEKYTISAII